MLVAFNDIFIDPADTCGVRAETWSDTWRKLAGGVIKVFKDSGAGPINICAIFKNDINKRIAEKGIAANHFGVRNSQHLRGQGVGNLVFDYLGCLSWKFSENNNLNIRKIGDGINWGVFQ